MALIYYLGGGGGGGGQNFCFRSMNCWKTPLSLVPEIYVLYIFIGCVLFNDACFIWNCWIIFSLRTNCKSVDTNYPAPLLNCGFSVLYNVGHLNDCSNIFVQFATGLIHMQFNISPCQSLLVQFFSKFLFLYCSSWLERENSVHTTYTFNCGTCCSEK